MSRDSLQKRVFQKIAFLPLKKWIPFPSWCGCSCGRSEPESCRQRLRIWGGKWGCAPTRQKKKTNTNKRKTKTKKQNKTKQQRASSNGSLATVSAAELTAVQISRRQFRTPCCARASQATAKTVHFVESGRHCLCPGPPRHSHLPAAVWHGYAATSRLWQQSRGTVKNSRRLFIGGDLNPRVGS